MSGPCANRASLSPLPRHEDGTVRFWDASGVSLKPLYKLGTASIFQTDCEHNDSLNQAGEEEWPPFRKVRSPWWRGRAQRMRLLEPSRLLPGDVSPSSGCSCRVTPHGDTRDVCSSCPVSWVCPNAGGEPGDAWGQIFPGHDARVPQPVPTSWLAGDVGVAWGGLSHSCLKVLVSPQSLPQVGCFDPYSDDPRLGVQKIALCKYTAKMVVAGTAGQVGRRRGAERGLLGTSRRPPWGQTALGGGYRPHGPRCLSMKGSYPWGLASGVQKWGWLVSPTACLCPLQVLVMELSDEKSEHAVSVATVDLLQDREGFTWKGHDRLAPRNGPLPFAPGFQPSVLVQCVPPAAVTAVTLHSEWNLVAFGTSHGFGLFDYYRRNPVLARYGEGDQRWGPLA